MKRKFIIGTMVMSAAVMLAGPAVAVYAEKPATTTKPEQKQSKLVSFTMRNDSSASISMKAGKTALTLEPGKTVSVQLEPGTQILATNKTKSYAQGSLISVVSIALADSILVLR